MPRNTMRSALGSIRASYRRRDPTTLPAVLDKGVHNVVTQRRRRLADMGFALVLCATLATCSNNDKSTSGGGTNSAKSADAAQVVAPAVSKTIDAGTAKAALDLDFTQLPGVSGAVKLSGAG